MFTIFRFIWIQMNVSLALNQSENGMYNMISIWFNKISKRFLCVVSFEYPDAQHFKILITEFRTHLQGTLADGGCIWKKKTSENTSQKICQKFIRRKKILKIHLRKIVRNLFERKKTSKNTSPKICRKFIWKEKTSENTSQHGLLETHLCFK